MDFQLDMFSSTVIVTVFSFVVVAMDEYLIKPMRIRHWEKLAAAGDPEKIELLRIAKSANVVDE